MEGYFQNPKNGYVEKAYTSVSWLWLLLFGVFYFALKGIWGHAIISFVLAFLTGGISWLIYPFFTYRIVRKHFLRKGWIPVKCGREISEAATAFSEYSYPLNVASQSTRMASSNSQRRDAEKSKGKGVFKRAVKSGVFLLIIIFLFVIIGQVLNELLMPSTGSLSNRGSIQQSYAPSEKGPYSRNLICKAGIAAIMGRSPKIMTASPPNNEIIFISYERGDGKNSHTGAK